MMGGHEINYALLTDLYEIAMMQGYFDSGMLDTEASFNAFYRDNPYDGGYAIACGTSAIADIVENLVFSAEDIDYLRSLDAPKGGRLFHDEFLDWLRNFKPTFSIDAVEEGRVVFPKAPLVKVTGNIAECQLIETVLLNSLNFQTLIATKAARVCHAAGGRAVSEFGLRRSQGPDGGISASRASIVGGCQSTSNVLAGKMFDVPVAGTHAHSWVQAFDSELEAFRAYAKSAPKNCVLLVDTYSVEQGIKNAIIVGKEMEEAGERLSAIRIDSGDLAELSKLARKMLDDAGLDYVKISVSNDLDEYLIESLLSQGAPLDMFGVGTKLATSYDQAALSGVYKLSAVKENDEWRPTLKISEQLYKLTIPGLLSVRRYKDKNGKPIGDMIVDPAYENKEKSIIVDTMDHTNTRDVTGFEYEELLKPFVVNGKVVYEKEPLLDAQKRAKEDLATFPEPIKRFLNPDKYPCGIEQGLFNVRNKIIVNLREEIKTQNERK